MYESRVIRSGSIDDLAALCQVVHDLDASGRAGGPRDGSSRSKLRTPNWHRSKNSTKRVRMEVGRVGDEEFGMAALCASRWSAMSCIDSRTRNLSKKEGLKG
jgi:hypothetical protein